MVLMYDCHLMVHHAFCINRFTFQNVSNKSSSVFFACVAETNACRYSLFFIFLFQCDNFLECMVIFFLYFNTSSCRLCPSKLKGFNKIATANPPADLTTFRSSIAVIWSKPCPELATCNKSRAWNITGNYLLIKFKIKSHLQHHYLGLTCTII